MAAFFFFQLAEKDCFKAMIPLRSWSHDHVMRLHHLLQEPTCRDVTVERLISRVTNGCIDPGVAITNHPTTGGKVGASPEPKHAAVAIITESKIV